MKKQKQAVKELGVQRAGSTGACSFRVWKYSVLRCDFWQFQVINRDLSLSRQLALGTDILVELSSHTTATLN